MEDLISGLIKIGLTFNESKIYSVLVRKGNLKVSEIIKDANVKTGKIYEILGLMQNKGLISSITKNGVKSYSASPPEKIRELVKEKEEEIKRVKDQTEKLIPELKKLCDSSKGKTSIELYIGDTGLKTILNMIINEISRNEKIYSLGVSGKREAYITNLWNHFAKKVLRKNCQLYFITSDLSSKTQKEIKKLKHKNTFFKTFKMFEFVPITVIKDYIIIDEYIHKNHILIKNMYIAQAFKDMIKNIWKLS